MKAKKKTHTSTSTAKVPAKTLAKSAPAAKKTAKSAANSSVAIAKKTAKKPVKKATVALPAKVAPAPVTAKSASAPVTRARKAAVPVEAVVPAPVPKRALAKRIRKPAAAPATASLPEILFEGDAPPAPPISGPGERYTLGAVPPAVHGETARPGELPEAYGTRRLTLVARDPHWLFAHWDFTTAQLREANRRSADKHLIVRIYRGAQSAGKAHIEQHVHPESRSWFIHVGLAGERYCAVLGHYDAARRWHVLSTSESTLTPPDRLSDDTRIQFSRIPAEVSFPQLLAAVRAAASTSAPLAQALEQLRAAGHPAFQIAADEASVGNWTVVDEKALAELVHLDDARRVWIGSLEITELIRRQVGRAGEAPSSLSLLPTSPAAPFGERRAEGFWFNVNAELVIYGATEADASVNIGGRPVKLRPDGTFSFRFSLPDGQYDLPCVALSANGAHGRAAELRFARATAHHGEVGTHPQDAALRPPTTEHIY